MPVLTRALFAASLLVALTGCEETPTGPSGGPITPGSTLRLQGGTGSVKTFTIPVPVGTGSLRVSLFAGSGDADLYVQYGAPAAPGGPYDCYSESSGGDEECHIDEPTDGTWYITVVGYTSYSNTELIAEFLGGTGAVQLQNNVAVTGLAGALNSSRLYYIDVPANATQLAVTAIGPNGDADLYVRLGAAATFNSYDCASAEEVSNEVCVVPFPEEGRWYILIDGFSAYTDLTLTAQVSMPAGVRRD